MKSHINRAFGTRGKLAVPGAKRYVLLAWLNGATQREIGAHVGIVQPSINDYLGSLFARYEAQVDPALPLRGRRIFAIMLALAALPASDGVMASPAVARAVASEAHAA